jgi:drug/metabolite transporter (DMT)-like permease
VNRATPAARLSIPYPFAMPRSSLLALAAIALWGTLASMGVLLAKLPPFLLTGLALLTGSLVALPLARGRWADLRVPWQTLAVGVYGLFGFHFLLFMALRTAPPVQTNLVNYLWPLGMVVMAPLFLPQVRLKTRHVLAACAGFAGAAVAIAGQCGLLALDIAFHCGYVLALGSAFIWASYSLLTRRLPAFPTAAIGSFSAASGLLALLCHALFEPATSLSVRDILLIAIMGIGPLGGAFYLWDAALKRGDPRQIGLLAFITPVLSTALLLWTTGQPLTPQIGLAAALVVGAAVLGKD